MLSGALHALPRSVSNRGEAAQHPRVSGTGHDLDRDVREADHGDKVPHLPGHDLRRTDPAQQREVVNQEPHGGRVIPQEDALLPRHPRGNPRADLILGDHRRGSASAPRVVLGLEQLTPLLDDALVLDEAVAGLRSYSLISEPNKGLISIHRLVQAITLAQLPDDLQAAWQYAAAAVIEAAIPANTDQPEAWPACAALLPHAQVALANDSDGLTRIANYLSESGSYAAARDLQQNITRAREKRFGPEDPRTLNARADLARFTAEAGDPVAAHSQLAALLPVCERVRGPAHPETVRVRAALAHWA
jgi:hypothetical protein